jgi:hypothetical protein
MQRRADLTSRSYEMSHGTIAHFGVEELATSRGHSYLTLIR